MKSSTIEIDLMTEMSHIIEIDHETTVEMNIGKKIIGISNLRNYSKDRSHSRDRSYSRDRSQGYYREFKDQRHERRSKDYYKDRYDKDNHRNSDKNKKKYQIKDQYKNDSYGKTSGSKERDYLYDEDDIFHSEIERVYKILQTMSPEKEMAMGFILAFSVNPDKILDSLCSPADVDHFIAKRIECGRYQKDTNLKTKDDHVNISNTSSQNYESINAGLELTQEAVDTEIVEESDSNSNSEEGIKFWT